MGTSMARRGPTTRLWRLAKGAATRYLAPEGAVPVAAEEVIARYVSALAESSHQQASDPLADFRLTRKVAQDLGVFWHQATSQGWEAALRGWGLEDLLGQPLETLAQGLAGAWVGAGGGLEAAVARASLITVLLSSLSGRINGTPKPSSLPSADSLTFDPPGLVGRFLTTAFYQRLVLDLGESLEAAAGDGNRLQRGLSGLRELIDRAGERAAGEKLVPEHWHGLAGWLWVTGVAAAMLRHFQGTVFGRGD